MVEGGVVDRVVARSIMQWAGGLGAPDDPLAPRVADGRAVVSMQLVMKHFWFGGRRTWSARSRLLLEKG